jgi:ferredoxin
MAYKLNPEFKDELKHFGKHNWDECFHCGNCTAICQLTEDNKTFPRKDMRYVQMGLTEKLDTSLEPWLCYYCGECTETCPRDANPGEMMMSLRRYLTSRYDWTGISRIFYKNEKVEFATIIIFFLAIVAAFLIWLPLKSNAAEMINAQGGVMINNLVAGISDIQFMKIIEYADWTMAVIVASLLISNILNMFYKTVIKDKSVKVPFLAYFKEAYNLVYHFITQAEFSKCDKKSRPYWFGHLLLMTGYTIMFIIIVVFLPYFQIEEIKPWYHWQRLLGYYATFGILLFLIMVAFNRIRKSETKLKFSHASDWIFIVLLGLTTITGILVHIFRLAGMVEATYYTYIIHLAVLIPMIIIEVPFSKWSHLAYRPFAIYFSKLKKAGLKKQESINPNLATA